MTPIYIVGYVSQGLGNTPVNLVVGYTNKQKADNLRDELAQANKGQEQFVVMIDLDPIHVDLSNT